MTASTLSSASSRPRPITTRCSAVRAISLIRWEDTNTVRPSAARERNRFRIHKMPSGSRPLMGSSRIKMAGITQQGGGQPEALSHPQREPAGPLGRHRGEADQIQDRVDAALVDAVGQRQAAQMVLGAAAGVERFGVQQRADFEQRPAVVGERPPVDQRRTRRGIVEAEDHAQGGGLARPVGSEEPGDHARVHVEAEMVDGDGLAVALGQLPYLDAR